MTFARAVGWAAMLAGLAGGGPARADGPGVIPPKDFVEYWAAGRVHLGGGDPYDPAAVLPLQRAAAGEPDRAVAVMLWTPPWTLPLYWPFAALPAREGHAAWLVAQGLTTAAGAVLLWAAYRGSAGPTGVAAALLLVVGFAPVWWTLGFGQNTGFLLLGLAGFVFFRTRDRPAAAGAFAALTAIKPHLLALFGVALVLDGLTRRGRRSLLAGAAVLAGLAALALVPDPRVYGEFVAALGRPAGPGTVPLADFQVPTAAYRLRWWLAGTLGIDARRLFWVQFAPCLIGCVATAAYWWRRRGAWDWAAETPRLVFASVLLAPYGAWPFDLTVLLVPVVQAAAWLARANRPLVSAAVAAGLLAASAATFDLRFVAWLHDILWFPPAVLGLYLAAGVLSRPRA